VRRDVRENCFIQTKPSPVLGSEDRPYWEADRTTHKGPRAKFNMNRILTYENLCDAILDGTVSESIDHYNGGRISNARVALFAGNELKLLDDLESLEDDPAAAKEDRDFWRGVVDRANKGEPLAPYEDAPSTTTESSTVARPIVVSQTRPVGARLSSNEPAASSTDHPPPDSISTHRRFVVCAVMRLSRRWR
jgi:hypothetical protein